MTGARLALAAVLATIVVVSGGLGLVGGAGLAAGLPGPMAATVGDVLDGDTFRARVAIWIDQAVDVSVRLRGVDAPEIHGKCEAERAAARQARQWLAGALKAGEVRLFDIAPDKYSGRIDARVEAGGVDLAQGLLAAGLARPYAGGARAGWC